MQSQYNILISRPKDPVKLVRGFLDVFYVYFGVKKQMYYISGVSYI